MNEVQMKIEKIKRNNFTNEELLHYLDSSAILVKLNAILAVLRLGITNEVILDKLSYIALRINEESKVFGLWNNAHFAIAALKILNTPESLIRFNKAVIQVDINAKTDIERLIKQLPEIL
jgi:hypothetical protein